MKQNLLVFASGTAIGGGSGFGKLCQSVLDGTLQAVIVGVVSNHFDGGVRALAKKYNIPFFYLPNDQQTAEQYQQLVRKTNAKYVALSGWIRKVEGLDPKTTFNIHPAELPTYGGKGMYGHRVHEAVIKDYQLGKITHTAVTMHWVTEGYDEGPIFFKFLIKILPDDTVETLGARVNKIEHEYQSRITNLILQGKIHWDGKDPNSVEGIREYMDAE